MDVAERGLLLYGVSGNVLGTADAGRGTLAASEESKPRTFERLRLLRNICGLDDAGGGGGGGGGGGDARCWSSGRMGGFCGGGERSGICIGTGISLEAAGVVDSTSRGDRRTRSRDVPRLFGDNLASAPLLLDLLLAIRRSKAGCLGTWDKNSRETGARAEPGLLASSPRVGGRYTSLVRSSEPVGIAATSASGTALGTCIALGVTGRSLGAACPEKSGAGD
jgi:hypothetical protein